MPESTPSPSIDLGRLAPGICDTLGDYLAQYRAKLVEAIRGGEAGTRVAAQHAKSLDGLLSALCCACRAASNGALVSRGRLALVAVGGFGRGLVGLESDVDVLFLCDDPTDPHVREVAEGVLYPLWDLGLEIGHAVRSADETLKLARDDLRTATTLLDLRCVAGDASIVDDLFRAARRQVFEPHLGAFLEMLEEDTTRRHERFGGSLYLLEPDVKLGRGGLRDIDVAEWAAKARWVVRRDEDYVRTGALRPREVEELNAAREMLWRVRNLLHLRAGRRQDRLTFPDQEELARELGFVDGATLAVEQFMQAYYRHARIVAQTAERMLDRARPAKGKRPAAAEDLANGAMIFDGQLTLRHSAELETDPALALRLYTEVASRGLAPYPFARDAIARIAAEPEWRERLRASPEAQKLFLALLCRATDPPLRARSMLSELHEVGLMTAMVPEFEPLTGRVQHDVYHVYTVDVHSVAAVDRLHALARGDLRAELPLPSRLIAEAPRPLPLYLGLLLHDVGKARGGKNHSEKGAEMAEPAAQRLGLSRVDVEHVVWLVREHLSLYLWAMRRDTSDPETIAEVASRIGSPERLRDLYLLTVADFSTTNPTAMTSWKARMLDDLYLAVAAHFEGDGGAVRQGRASSIRDEVRLLFGASDGDGVEAFVRDMPDRYFLANAVETIVEHARAAARRGPRTVHVARGPAPTPDVSELLVTTDDRPRLLADVTAVLASHRLSVVAAQIYTRPRRDGTGTRGAATDEAFDVFHVRRDAQGSEPVDEPLRARIERDLGAVAEGALDAEQLLSRLPRAPAWATRRVPDVRTEVVVDNAISGRFTVVDVFTRDRVGLLHAVAKTLSDLHLGIALSKVGTEGARATDVFYVEENGGGKVKSRERLDTIKKTLERALAEYHAELDAG